METSTKASTASMEVAASMDASTEVVAAYTGSLEYFHESCRQLARLSWKLARVCSVRYVPRHTAGITGTGHFGKFGTTSIPVPDISVSSVRHSYRYQTIR